MNKIKLEFTLVQKDEPDTMITHEMEIDIKTKAISDKARSHIIKSFYDKHMDNVISNVAQEEVLPF